MIGSRETDIFQRLGVEKMEVRDENKDEISTTLECCWH